MDAFITRSIEAHNAEIELDTLSSLPSTIPSTLLPQEITETPPPIGRHAHLLFHRRNDHIIVRGKEYTKTKALASRREDRKEATSPIWKYGGSYTNSQGKHFFYCNLCAIKTGTVQLLSLSSHTNVANHLRALHNTCRPSDSTPSYLQRLTTTASSTATTLADAVSGTSQVAFTLTSAIDFHQFKQLLI